MFAVAAAVGLAGTQDAVDGTITGPMLLGKYKEYSMNGSFVKRR